MNRPKLLGGTLLFRQVFKEQLIGERKIKAFTTEKPATWKVLFLIQFVAVSAMDTLTIVKTARQLSSLKAEYMIKFKTCLKVNFIHL